MKKRHWEGIYADQRPDAVSWYQREPALSLALIEAARAPPGDPVIDVCGGASLLVDRLLERGFTEVTVVDLAETGLAAARARLGPLQERVHWQVADIRDWAPVPGAYALWHDRAVLRFLVTEAGGRSYLRALERGFAPAATPCSPLSLPAARSAAAACGAASLRAGSAGDPGRGVHPSGQPP